RANDHVAHDVLELRIGDEAGPQQAHLLTVEAHDGGFEPDLAFTAVEHHADGVTELLAHVLRARGAHAAEAVRRRRGDAAAESRQELLGHRVRGYADG